VAGRGTRNLIARTPREFAVQSPRTRYPGLPTVRVGKYKPNLRIAELRKARGMTQAELAEKAQLGPAGRAQIARFETGSRTPTWDTLARLAAALRCRTINQLFGPMPVSPPPRSTVYHRTKKRKA
jgi:DNA-binding XRE family transcriptional regulator